MILPLLLVSHYSLHSFVSTSTPATDHPDVIVAPPQSDRSDTHPLLLFCRNDTPTQMTSSAHAIAVTAMPSPSRELAREQLSQIVSEDWYSLSECSKSSSTESLTRIVGKKLSKAKENVNKFVQWLREVENV